MLKYGITIFIVTAAAICGYFLFAYKLDTIVLYDRAAAYTSMTPYFSAVPEFLISGDNELRVIVNFEDIRETVYLNNLEINISPVNATPLTPIAVRNDERRCEANSYRELPCQAKMLQPLTEDQHFTFTFNTSHSHTKRYLVTIMGDVMTGPYRSSFRKQIKIQEKAVFLERN
jgi:hypothetical protein